VGPPHGQNRWGLSEALKKGRYTNREGIWKRKTQFKEEWIVELTIGKAAQRSFWQVGGSKIKTSEGDEMVMKGCFVKGGG